MNNLQNLFDWGFIILMIISVMLISYLINS